MGFIHIQNNNLENNGVVNPISGNGTVNTYWTNSGAATYRVVNGWCQVFYDVNKKDTQLKSGVISGLPKSKMNAYQNVISKDGTKNVMFYVLSDDSGLLYCDAASAGNFAGSLCYPVK